MDIPQTIHDYLQAQAAVIAHSVAVIERRTNAGAIHRLRVAIKKTRACLELAAHLGGQAFSAKKHFRFLKPLQAATGALRDLQLQALLLQRYAKRNGSRYPLLQLLLKNNYALALQQLKAATKAFRRQGLEHLPHEAVQHISDKEAEEEVVKQYLQEQWRRIQAPAGRVRQEAWHDLRKQIKGTYFQLHLLKHALHHKKQTGRLLAASKKAGYLLGNWHDLHQLWLFAGNALQLARRQGIAIPRNMERLLQQVNADSKAYLQQCRALLKRWPSFTGE